MAGEYNFQMYNNEDFDRVLTWSQSSIPVSQGGRPVDLTDYTAFMSIGTTEQFITTTISDNGQITLGGDLGTIRMVIPAGIAGQFVNSAPLYRLFMVAESGESMCLMAGAFQVLP